MQYKNFGKTNLTVSRVGFGSMHLPKLTQSQTDKLLHFALDEGITYIDTANNYQDSEQKIGKAIASRRNQYVLSTKTNKRTYLEAKKEIENSLLVMRTDCIDVMHIHYVNEDWEFQKIMCPENGAIRALEEARQAGHIRYLAISGHRPDKLAEWLRVYAFDSVLFHLNICQPFASYDLMPTVAELGIGSVAMKPLAGGLVHPNHIRYLLTQDTDVILPGFMKVQEIQQNIKLLTEPITDSEAEALLALAAIVSEHHCRRCNRCSCPVGIKITDALIPSLYMRQCASDLELTDWHKRRGPIEKCATRSECSDIPLCEADCPYRIEIARRIRSIK